MATYRARLVGGPCDGQIKTLTQAEWDAGETSCKGETYVFDGIKPRSGRLAHFTFRAGAPPPPPTGGGSSGASVAPNVYRAWSDVERSVNRRLPTALHRIGISQRRLLQALAHKRRVKG